MAARTVVGAAIVADGRVLAARRTRPPELAGLWEFSGGKVEAGESEQQALARELREELAVEVTVGRLLGRTRISAQLRLAVYVCQLHRGVPTAGEHDRLRWLTADELNDVEWIDSDRALLPALGAQLCSAKPGPSQPDRAQPN